ncbi:MAG: hypothetical protein R3B53_04780 [Candidatus Paceibacterota bacterium]
MILIFLLVTLLVVVIATLFFFGIQANVRYYREDGFSPGFAEIEPLNFIFGAVPAAIFGLHVGSSVAMIAIMMFTGHLIVKFFVNELGRLVIRIIHPKTTFKTYSLKITRLGRPRWSFPRWT